MSNLDQVQFEVLRHALTELTEEMALALKRSAYSTNIKTRSDFSCAFFDRDLRPIAQAFAQPNHLGSLVEQVPRVVRAYGPDNLAPGDMLIANDPYLGGVHLNDITIIAPVYDIRYTIDDLRLPDSALLGYVASLAHHVDVGGGAPASVGAFREVFQEGVIIPPARLVRGGQMVDDVFRLVLSQIRSKRETAGDFRAQVAANLTGLRRLTGLVARYGAVTLQGFMDELIEYTERRARAELLKLPRGVYTAEGTLDTDGYTDRPVRLCVRVVIDDEGVLFDLTGSDAQRRAPVNATYAQTYSACAYALKCLMDPDVPTNAGFYRLVRVVAPAGTVVNSAPPAPVVGGWETNLRLTDLIFKALAPALPDRIPAGTKAMICHAGFGGIDPRSGEYYCFLETLAGGYGGRSASDGPDAVQTHGQNTENAPVEETEAGYPVRIVRYELVEDSAGAGKFRGGLGLRRDYLFPDHEATFTILADRDRAGPHGLFGGEPGRPAEYILNPGTPGERRLSSKTTVELEPGDVVSYRTCGGGGYGPPAERAPDLVWRDMREGKVHLG
ncbi:MAG: hydantoinase B/oxoprolinase family protein [Anaerolineae bacterium]|nr:hydantoinase B/oxoprolinase family protein [Anaerolineae bacterium]